MKSQTNHDELHLPVAAVRRAARLCRQVSKDAETSATTKGDLSPVTVADFGSQAVICQALGEACPGQVIVAEENSDLLRKDPDLLKKVTEAVCRSGMEASADQICRWIDQGRAAAGGESFWTLDPIDGTKGYLRNDQYAIALAKIQKGRPKAAVLGCPNLSGPNADSEGLIFTALAGGGTRSHFLDQTLDQSRTVSTSPTTRASEAVFCESVESGHSDHSVSARLAERLNIQAEPFRIDSQCKYAAVASGWAEIYLRLSRKDYQECIWDHAAGALVVEEAGGTVTDLHGRPLEFQHGQRLVRNHGVVATNGPLHRQVVEALQPLL
ncbi:MAG: 3'(2'),5'-bisphosphate nucleotidase [Phycisphaeraceae bacterium]|nr:3'(2'),5'-bisphosphate nucleotidase [Phycisphaeraceae bacterium]